MKLTCFNCLGDGILFDEGEEFVCTKCNGTGKTELTQARAAILIQKFESDAQKYIDAGDLDRETEDWFSSVVINFEESDVSNANSI